MVFRAGTAARGGGSHAAGPRAHPARSAACQIAAQLLYRGVAVAAALLLTGCLSLGDALDPASRIDVLEETSEFRIITPGQGFVHAPEAILTLERNLGRAVEQRTTLPNRTTLPGDNKLVIRAQTPRSINTTTFRLEEFLERMGGAPAPFAGIADRDLQTGRDSLGPYFWAERRVGADTICVVAFRRIGFSARPLPQGADALDVMLRNCVAGGTEEALAPIGARRLADAPVSPQDALAPAFRTLSPHAAPQARVAAQ